MRLTTRSRYGTRMALDIALHGQNGPVRIGDISKRQGVSVKYLEKLVRELKSGGFITSKRGPKGGHKLAKPAEDILLGDIVRLLEGEPLVECIKNNKPCPRLPDCNTSGIWQQASSAMYAKLNEYTLADLVREAEHCPS